MIFKKVDVQMGAVGSDDDIRMKICDSSKCCTTKVLSHTFSSEWVKNKLETWDGSKLGNCSSILFDDKLTDIKVNILKAQNKKDSLEVTSLVLTAQAGTIQRKFKCGGYKFTANDNSKENICANENSIPKTTKRPATSAPKKAPLLPVSSGSLPNLKIKKINVQVGPVGTDEDVSMQICDPTKCCTTKVLSHTFGSEWVKNKLETWDGRKLGNCSDILFNSEAPGLTVTVNKGTKKKQALDITSIVVEASPTTDQKIIKKFKCGSFKFTGADARKESFCSTEGSTKTAASTANPTKTVGDVKNYKVNTVIVQMGDDGTNDDVSLEVCNAKSALNCCDTGKLSSLLSDDWSKNDKETWKNKDLGPCKSKTWDACKGFDVAVKKKSGKDSLKVRDITLELVETADAKKKQKFICSNYNVGATDTIRRQNCVLDKSSNLNCPKTTKAPLVTTKRPTTTTKKSSRATTRKTVSSSGSDNVILKGFEVQVGRDGTRDKVTAKVCASDQKVCCETLQLMKRQGNNWVRNGNESWTGSSLGLCQDMSFPTKTRTTLSNLLETKLLLTLKKTGKDGLKLENFNIDTVSTSGQKRRFKCGKLSVLDTNMGTAECYARYAKPLTSTTRSGPCLRSGKNCPSKTTTRPPFRSGSG